MRDFGEFPSLSLECSSVIAAIQFICYLHQENRAISKINELWYKIFTKKNLSGDRLPLTLDALVFHLRIANYQTFIWKSACMPVLNLLPSIGNGWQMEDEKICEELMLNSSVPGAIVELKRYQCKKGSKTNSCSCFLFVLSKWTMDLFFDQLCFLLNCMILRWIFLGWKIFSDDF